MQFVGEDWIALPSAGCRVPLPAFLSEVDDQAIANNHFIRWVVSCWFKAVNALELHKRQLLKYGIPMQETSLSCANIVPSEDHET